MRFTFITKGREIFADKDGKPHQDLNWRSGNTSSLKSFREGEGFRLSLMVVLPHCLQARVVYRIHSRSSGSCRSARRISRPK
jgi:hypothetical protein